MAARRSAVLVDRTPWAALEEAVEEEQWVVAMEVQAAEEVACCQVVSAAGLVAARVRSRPSPALPDAAVAA